MNFKIVQQKSKIKKITKKKIKIWVIFEEYFPICYSFIAQLSKQESLCKTYSQH